MNPYRDILSIYKCEVCGRRFGVFYVWYEDDHNEEPSYCPVCGSAEDKIRFIEDRKELIE